MSNDPTQAREPETPLKFHCVMQLRETSWEYRWKRPDEEPNCDDLVSWDDYLALHDRLKLEHDAWDKKRIAELQKLRADLTLALAGRAELLAALKDLRINANRLCDRQLGGTYEEDCRRSIAAADTALAATLGGTASAPQGGK